MFPEVSLGVVLFSVLKEILGTQELRPSCLTSPDKVPPSRQKAGCLRFGGSQPVGSEPPCLRLYGRGPCGRILLTGITLYFSLEVRF